MHLKAILCIPHLGTIIGTPDLTSPCMAIKLASFPLTLARSCVGFEVALRLAWVTGF